MNGRWYLLRTGPGAASWNMALDEALLENISSIGEPVLRLYAWTEPAATFGYFQKFSEIASWTSLRPIIRRPTGGGLVPHDADWTYSLVFPPGHPWFVLRAEESYRQAHDWISESFGSLAIQAQLSRASDKPAPGRCFVGAEKFDVMAAGKKIAGAAQKRNKFGLLIQGSIQPPDGTAARKVWEEALLECGRRRFSVACTTLELPEAVRLRASELDREKYGTVEYNRRR